MAELFGAIQRGLGAVLNGVYETIPSYGLAIIVLTVVARLLLLPLTIKQTRSMQKMQILQPEMKKIQAKYKDLQKKAKDRQELQQLRLKMNEETMALFRQHGASPYGGCLPMLAQMPVFIALFSVFRASVVGVAMSASIVGGASGVPADQYTEAEVKATICRPAAEAPTVGDLRIECRTRVEGAQERVVQYDLDDLREVTTGGANGPPSAVALDPAMVAVCRPQITEGGTVFRCGSAAGTGHLPRDGALFADVNSDEATVFGMHSGCSPSQAGSDARIVECTASEDAKGGFPAAIPYYLIVLGIAGTQYLSGRQMLQRSKGGQMQQQQQMMMRIMPLLFGFISLNFPTGLNTYYLVFNIWQIGQQTVMFRAQDRREASGNGSGAEAEEPKKGLLGRLTAGSAAPVAEEPAPVEDVGEDGKPKPHPRSKKKGKRKRR